MRLTHSPLPSPAGLISATLLEVGLAISEPENQPPCQRVSRLLVFKLSSRLNPSPPAAPAVPAARPQLPVLSVPCGAARRPAGSRQG